MNLFWTIALIGLGLVLSAHAVLKLLLFFTLRRYNRMPDTHDLKSRANKLAADYIDKRPHGALAPGCYRRTRVTFKAMDDEPLEQHAPGRADCLKSAQ